MGLDHLTEHTQEEAPTSASAVREPDDWWVKRAFLYAGRITEEKGVPIIIGAWSVLHQEMGETCPPLWLAGGVPEEIELIRANKDLRNTIAYAESAGKLHWWGYLDASGVSALLLRALALVTHSQYEPGGRIVLEAMTEGVPVIATPHGFARDLVSDWKTGFLVPYGDLGLLKKRMGHFAVQPLLRNALGDAARQTATAALRSWNFMDAHYEAYKMAFSHSTRATNQSVPESAIVSRLPVSAFCPTYPYYSSVPTHQAIRDFLELTLGNRIISLRPHKSNAGRSLRWIVDCSSQRWLVKWPYPCWDSRRLWDDLSEKTMATGSAERFSTEVFSAQMPQFARIFATDPKQHLILRPFSRTPKLNLMKVNGFSRIGESLKKLSSVKFADPLRLRVLLTGDLDRLDLNDLKVLRKTIRTVIASTGLAWNRDRHVSLRIAWQTVRCQFDGGVLGVPPEINTDIKAHIGMILGAVEFERQQDLVMCHGDVHSGHFVQIDNELLLIDGEKLHPAFPGEDFANLIGGISDSFLDFCKAKEFAHATVCLSSPVAEEQRMVAVWLALLSLEGIRRGVAMELKAYTSQYIRRWNLALDVLRSI